MKTLLILTGPQGSGNHLWSKIFALHPDVYAWHALLHEYWIGPNIVRFAATAMGLGIRVKIGIIGRDRNILNYQETRVRGQPTHDLALAEYEKLTTWNPVFLSYELLHLYGKNYLQQISKQLEFPIDFNNPGLNNILTDDTNSKYFQPVDHHPTDDLARHTSRKWK